MSEVKTAKRLSVLPAVLALLNEAIATVYNIIIYELNSQMKRYTKMQAYFLLIGDYNNRL